MTPIFGIDLGTTNSLIAIMDGAQPRVIADPASGNPLLPSVVALTDEGVACVGDPATALEIGSTPEIKFLAEANANKDKSVVIRSVKRYMGLGVDDLAPEDRRRYSFADLSGPVARFSIGDRTYTPPQISAEILR